jgi:BirA family biotin operon repressor/biotin-[acetyl-CoA-carboxylase] ligase
MFGRRFQHGITDSTNERAFAALAAGTARHGDLHVALGQNAGRGRRGRSWESAPGEGLYLSAVLLPPAPLPAAALTVAGGLAVHDALRSFGLAAPLRLTWPNDVLAGGAKIAGVLAETRGLDERRPHYVVGVGVNVGQRSFSPALLAGRHVTSMRLCGARASVQSIEAAVTARLTERLAQARGDHGHLARDFLAATGLAGQRVRVRAAGRECHGELVALCLDAGVLVRSSHGDDRLPLELIRELAAAAPG